MNLDKCVSLCSVSWYVSALCLLGTISISAITIGPEHEGILLGLSVVLLTGSLLFAFLASTFRAHLQDRVYYRTGWPLRLYIGFAGILTLLLLLFGFG